MRKKLVVKMPSTIVVGIKGKHGKTINELTSRKTDKTVINEMEYNGVNSRDR